LQDESTSSLSLGDCSVSVKA